MSAGSPFVRAADGARVAIRLTPRADRDSLDGLAATRDGRPALAARVRAVPEKGRANEALLRLLSDAFGVPPGRLSLVGGPKDRHKTVLVAGEPDAVLRALEDWLKAAGYDR